MATTTSNWNIPSPTDPDEWDLTSNLGTMATAIDAAISTSGYKPFKTLADLLATPTDGLTLRQYAKVLNDPNSNNNGVYVWTGAAWKMQGTEKPLFWNGTFKRSDNTLNINNGSTYCTITSDSASTISASITNDDKGSIANGFPPGVYLMSYELRFACSSSIVVGAGITVSNGFANIGFDGVESYTNNGYGTCNYSALKYVPDGNAGLQVSIYTNNSATMRTPGRITMALISRWTV